MRDVRFLLLVVASTSGFEFFVTRQDGVGFCVTNEGHRSLRDLVPFYNIYEKNQVVPLDQDQKWSDAWHLQNLRVNSVSSWGIGLSSFASLRLDRAEQYKSILKFDHNPKFLLLATNATLIWSERDDWSMSRSFRFHLNYQHPEQEGKATWVEWCTNIKEKNCELLGLIEDKTGGLDILSEGLRWTWLLLNFDHEDLSLLTENGQLLMTWRFGKDKFRPQYLFARTFSVPGAVWIPLDSKVEPSKTKRENSMSRNVTVGSEGMLCLEIQVGLFAGGHVCHVQVEDFFGRIVIKRRFVVEDDEWTRRGRYQLNVGAGNFTLHLRNISEEIVYIGLCSEMEVRGPSDGCLVYKEYFDSPVKALYPSQLNRSVTVDLTVEQMRRVCSALEVGPDDPAPLFSGKNGANFKKCP